MFSAVLIMPSLALIVPLAFNTFPYKLAPKVPNSISIKPPFCYFASILIVLLTTYINKPDFSRGLTIFIISFISSFEIIIVVIPNPKIFLWIAPSVADATTVNPNGFKTLLADV